MSKKDEIQLQVISNEQEQRQKSELNVQSNTLAEFI